jgi:hypothetical protein
MSRKYEYSNYKRTRVADPRQQGVGNTDSIIVQKKKEIINRQEMKNKLLTTTLLLLLCTGALSQTSTALTVRLENNPEHKTKVDLVFENNTNEEILLLTKFDDLTFGGEKTGHSSITMQFFYDGRQMNFNFGVLRYTPSFSFSWGSVNIAPHSKVRLPFDIGRISPPLPECVMEKLEVSFLMNYFYILVEREEAPMGGVFLVTNRVAIAEPAGDIEKEE